jgi:hypothetical protein
MVLGSFDKGMTYPRSLYESASAYGFGYFPNSLGLMRHPWLDEENTWLAFLHGLSYERILPERTDNESKAWKEYIQRIKKLLQSGSPVQITKGWWKQSGYKEERGKIIQESLGRLFWWEGMTSKVRPDMHYFTAVGLDESQNVLIINDGIYGWVGKAAYGELRLDILRRLVTLVPEQHKYITITFKSSNEPRKSDEEIDRLVKNRIIKKLRGDPSVYDSLESWRSIYNNDRFPGFLYSREALVAFKNDLYPAKFERILKFRHENSNIEPADIISWLDLWIYHQSNIAFVTAEYLEESGKLKEWEWLFNYHILYEKLRSSTRMLRSVFKNNGNIDQAIEKCKPILEKMRLKVNEMISHIELYLEQSKSG